MVVIGGYKYSVWAFCDIQSAFNAILWNGFCQRGQTCGSKDAPVRWVVACVHVYTLIFSVPLRLTTSLPL